MIAIAMIAFALLVGAQTPTMPVTDAGACPFECCRYGSWTAKGSVSVKETRNQQSPVAFRIAQSETVTARTGVVVTRKPGVVRMLKSYQFGNLTLPAGAILYVLHHGGEGTAFFWYEGKTYWAELYAESVHKGNDKRPWDVKSLPVTEWWVQVQNRRGATGWILNPMNFDGMDACS